ncbi:Tubulin-tyrosine ligase family protein [Mariniphaga anaerophila]|uniref:Tubulin-tyrosine ligase family protein n=1 Tax=Mariniphaga anaerophila TaxID=1484053 RepID=A0A1M4VU13_9BACT|nr:hypothetical protein [Mariniphaga anaerophila]SHE72323.1 Tubulin-tyrosine ligase family protein [Mariniphaga anaerophila]
MNKKRLKAISEFEFWPMWLFYLPAVLYSFILVIRSGFRIVYFSATNPGMKFGGAFHLSKHSYSDFIPEKYRPQTFFVDSGLSPEKALKSIDQCRFPLPFIVKPDVGERGIGVELIRSKKELVEYIYTHQHSPLLIQEYIDYPLEYGVFYYRMPGTENPVISSITSKEFFYAEGDGRQTLAELLSNNRRINHRKDYLQQRFADKWNSVLPKGEKLLIEPVGNHNRGTIFRNSNYLVCDEIANTFDQIARSYPGFYYGRFDVKVHTPSDLKSGNNMKIIEINGVNSEPTHIYDPEYNLRQAYRDVFRHMNIIFEISRRNRRNGAKTDSAWRFAIAGLKHTRSRQH